MRRSVTALLLIATIFTLLSINHASAATPVVRITDKPHTGFDGKFRDNELATSLLPDGKLGKLVSSVSNARKTWVIDPALIAEVIDMADGYTFEGDEQPLGSSIATLWLQQLRNATLGNPIVALPYGNPDPSLARKLAPSEIKFYSQIAAEKLEAFFGRPVISQNGWSSGKSKRISGIYSQFVFAFAI